MPTLKKTSNEANIQSAVLDLLAIKEKQRELMYWRSNNIQPSGIKKDGKRFFYKANVHAKKGIPDIIVIKDGFFIGLEIKDKEKQSDGQKEFEKLVKQNGGEYHIIKSVDQLKEIGL